VSGPPPNSGMDSKKNSQAHGSDVFAPLIQTDENGAENPRKIFPLHQTGHNSLPTTVSTKAAHAITTGKLGRKRLAELDGSRSTRDPGELWCTSVCHEILLGKIVAVAEWTGGMSYQRSSEELKTVTDTLWDAPRDGLDLLISRLTKWTKRNYTINKIEPNDAKIMIDFAFSEVLFARYLPPSYEKGYLLFIFSFGCVCLWDCPEEHRVDVLHLISPALLQRYQNPDDLPTTDFDITSLAYDEDTLNYFPPRHESLNQSIDEEVPTDDNHTLHNLLGNGQPNCLDGGNADAKHGLEEDLYDSLVAYSSQAEGLRQHKKRHIQKKIPPGTIKGDTIALINKKDRYERVAYSYALAQSCKLTVFEDNIDNSLSITRELPETLAKTGRISLNREEISTKIGELFSTRFYVNLYSDILDTPEFYWDHDVYEHTYKMARNYLEIPKRVNNLNSRLDIIKDLYDMLNQEILAVNGMKLEWIVIYLVLAEVLIELVWNILIRDTLKLV